MQQLEYRAETRPDRTGEEVLDGADTASPPAWSGLASRLWNRGNWDATVLVQYLAGYDSNETGGFFNQFTATPSWTTVDFRLGYRFPDGLWRGHAKGLHVQAGLGNIGDRQPPFSNSVYGYNEALYSPSVAPTISRSHCRFKVGWVG